MNTTGFGDLGERLRRSTVHIRVAGEGQGSGSGIICGSSGQIVTNAHVSGWGGAAVELWDGRRLDARVTASDPKRDLAVLEIAAGELPAASFGDSSALRPGELVVAIGNPLGFTGALTTGVVYGVGPLPGLGRREWVQADVRLAPGNSGGPLADARGRVIGINTMVANGLGLAVPSNTVQAFLTRASNTPRLGITVRPVPLERGASRSAALLVLEVEPGGPAANASLLAGDLLIAAEGKPFRSLADLGNLLGSSKGAVHVEFLRGDRRVARSVCLLLGTKPVEAR